MSMVNDGKGTLTKKLTWGDMLPESDPVWAEEGGPRPFFRHWFEAVAERRFHDKSRWIDSAIELGYLIRLSPDEYDFCYFEFSPEHYRLSLGLEADMPLLRTSENKGWNSLWDRLLREDNHE